MSDSLRVHIAARRAERGWTQAELARRAGLSRAAVSAMETGRVVPSTAAALALARVFGTPVETLFELAGSGRSGGPRWAWGPPEGAVRWWEAELGGGVARWPVETLAVGLVPHDGPGGVRGDPARTLVLAGCDPAVGLLTGRLAGTAGVRVLPFVRSSRRSLELLREGRVHVAGLHLRSDPASSAALVREELGDGYRVLHVAVWTEGVALAPGLGLGSVGSAVGAGLRWVGREEGSGARQCLDEVLENRRPEGYDRTASGHRGVVETILTGWAQAGVCVELAAAEGGLDFHPVRRESYDLCYPASLEGDPRLEALADAVRGAAYRRLLADLPGYDAGWTGERA